MKRTLGFVAAALVLAASLPASAQNWPTKPVKIIVPYAPGGITDIAARIVGAKLTEAFKQQFVVENRPGGNGTIGVGTAIRAPADGYTFLMATVGDFTITPLLIKSLPYNVEKDLVPISSLTDTPVIVGVHVNSPYKTLKDLIDDAKTKPGKISVGTPGNGSINQLLMEAIALKAGVKFQHIPYKGGAPSAKAVAAGDIPVGFLAVSSALPHTKAGRIRTIATTNAKRSPHIADVPTVAEAGIAGVEGSNYTALMARTGTPQAIIDKLHVEVLKALEDPELKKRLAVGAGVTIPSTGAELAARLKREMADFKEIVEKAKITAN
jgi:tripartite-type tricarboxylate transporter receptor subunit TctC